jgi:aminoglycoside 6'-N-acetyltransferase I
MSDTHFTIRPFCEDDLGEWFRLRSQLWDETPEEDHKGEMMDIMENSDTQFVGVADVGGGRLAGFIEASIRPYVDDCASENVGYLEGWYVEAPYRGQGIGSKLVGSSEEWARSRGCIEMASDSEVDNAESIAAHDELGYEETSRLVHFRKDLI